jgi:hypothetical protein
LGSTPEASDTCAISPLLFRAVLIGFGAAVATAVFFAGAAAFTVFSSETALLPVAFVVVFFDAVAIGILY